jgi:hypothetical protein
MSMLDTFMILTMCTRRHNCLYSLEWLRSKRCVHKSVLTNMTQSIVIPLNGTLENFVSTKMLCLVPVELIGLMSHEIAAAECPQAAPV